MAEFTGVEPMEEVDVEQYLPIWYRDHEHKSQREWLAIHEKVVKSTSLEVVVQAQGLPHFYNECYEQKYCPRHASENLDQLKASAAWVCEYIENSIR